MDLYALKEQKCRHGRRLGGNFAEKNRWQEEKQWESIRLG